MNNCILILALVGVLFACESEENKPPQTAPVHQVPDPVPSENERESGKPIEIVGKVVSLDTMPAPKSVKAHPPVRQEVHPNRHKINAFPTYPYLDTLIALESKTPSERDTAKGTFERLHTDLPTEALPMKFMESARYNIQYLDVDEGLNASHFWSLIQDARGFIWAASHDAGVVRYDGHQWQQYTTSNGLRDNSIRFQLEDSKGRIWFAYKGDGVSVYDGHQLLHYDQSNGLADGMVESFFEDSKGNIWIGYNGAGVSKFDGLSFTHFNEAQGLIGGVVRDMVELENGDIWFGTWGKGICVYNGQTFKQILNVEGKLKGHIRDLYKDSKGNIWVATYMGGVMYYDGEKFHQITTNEGLPTQRTYSLTEDHQGGIWIGTDEGLCVLKDSVLTTYGTNEGLRNQSIRTLLTDGSGNIWMGTWGGGIQRFGINPFEHYTPENGFPSSVSGISQDLDGSYWISSQSGVLAHYDGTTIQNYPTKEVLNEGTLFSVVAANDGTVWSATMREGLCAFDGETFTSYSKQQGFPTNFIMTLDTSPDGHIWAGTNGGGICEFDGEKITQYAEEQGLSDNIVRALETDKNGGIWAGTWSEGLCRIKDDSITYFTEKEGLSGKHIYCLKMDHLDRLWVGTETGLNVLDTRSTAFNAHSFQHLDQSHGLSNNVVLSLVLDDENNLWASTKKGLNKISLEGQNDSPIFSSGRPNIQTFERNDGILSSDFFLNSALIDNQNNLWSASGRSLVKLALNELPSEHQPPRLYLSRIEFGGKFIDFHATEKGSDLDYARSMPFFNTPIAPEFKYDQNHLDFYFSGIDFSGPEKLNYQFKLEGLEDDWSTPSSEAKASYRKLPHAAYTLHVRAINRHLIQSDELHYSFVIHPPWWKTWWANTLWLILIVLGLFSLHKWKTFKLRKRQVELEETVEERTHEIRAKKQEVEIQKEIVEVKNKEIMDSISYAKRIQTAILPPRKLVKEYLKDSFILYLPKDIVAGDFYWMEHKDNKVIFAAADCTGHGVPGAMVSVVCNNGLNRSVREHGLTDPGKILDKTRELLLEEFGKAEENVKDGMDIALCSLEGNTLQYAGAYNPLWIIRKDAEIIEEINADRQPIGNFGFQKPFTTHTITLEKGDTIYIFSDGYADQFGGIKGKKLKSTSFKTLLLSIRKESLEKQRELIHDAFETWKGDLEQIDDVCVIGVRV